MFQVSRVAYHPSARVFKTSYCMFNGLGFFGCWEVDCFLLSGVGDGMLFFNALHDVLFMSREAQGLDLGPDFSGPYPQTHEVQ